MIIKNKKMIFSICALLTLCGCIFSSTTEETYYIPHDFKGYILILYDNYDKNIQNEYTYEIDESGYLFSDYSFHREGPIDWTMFSIENSEGGNKVTPIHFGDDFNLCNGCSDNAKEFEEKSFFYVDGGRKSNADDSNFKIGYNLFLVCEPEDIEGMTESQIYKPSQDIMNYFHNLQDNIREDTSSQEGLKTIIKMANEKFNPPNDTVSDP